MWQAANDEFSSANVIPINKTTCPLRFPGQYYDEESGLHYNRHRYYDPETAQYLSPDPLGLGGGTRPQGYVDNPLSWIDPLGLAECPVRKVNGTKIFGKGQKDGTPGHDQFSEAIANKLAMSGKFKEIYLNRSYNFANGKDISGRRPDVMAIDKNGKVHAIELASKTDMGRKLPELTTRNESAMSNLPASKQGEVIILENPYGGSDIKNKLDALIFGI
nr:RHS repeat-associated core domain-containing protein [Pseudomonas sp. Fl5BN2]